MDEIQIMDYYFYNPLTDSSASSYFTKGSTATMSFNSQGMTSYASSSGNQSVSNHIILNTDLPDDFEIEFTWMGGISYTGNVWADGIWFQTDNNHASVNFNTYYNYSGADSSETIVKNHRITSGDKFKYVKNGNLVEIYCNDVLMISGNYKSHSLGKKLKIINCCGNTNRSTIIKDLKIKQL